MTNLNRESTDNNRRLIGEIVSNKMNKSVVVQVKRRIKHSVLGKIIIKSAKYKAHDEVNQYHEGDIVEIIEGRPISRSKSWRVARLIKTSKKFSS